jgi:hypothetical protein
VQRFAHATFGRSLSIDRMATRANRRLTRFCSVSACDPDSVGFSAFCSDWKSGPAGTSELNYCFPPFSLIPRVVQHVEHCRAKAVLILPHWPSQSWWVHVQSLSVGMSSFPSVPVFETVKDDRWQPVMQTSFAAVMVAVDGARAR